MFGISKMSKWEDGDVIILHYDHERVTDKMLQRVTKHIDEALTMYCKANNVSLMAVTLPSDKETIMALQSVRSEDVPEGAEPINPSDFMEELGRLAE